MAIPKQIATGPLNATTEQTKLTSKLAQRSDGLLGGFMRSSGSDDDLVQADTGFLDKCRDRTNCKSRNSRYYSPSLRHDSGLLLGAMAPSAKAALCVSQLTGAQPTAPVGRRASSATAASERVTSAAAEVAVTAELANLQAALVALQMEGRTRDAGACLRLALKAGESNYWAAFNLDAQQAPPPDLLCPVNGVIYGPRSCICPASPPLLSAAPGELQLPSTSYCNAIRGGKPYLPLCITHRVGGNIRSKVFVGNWNGCPVAIKAFCNQRAAPEDLVSEMAYGRFLMPHANLMRYSGYIVRDGTYEEHPSVSTALDIERVGERAPDLLVVMEHMDGNNLEHYLQTIRRNGAPQVAMTLHALLAMLAASRALQHLHSQRIGHFDVQPCNMFVQVTDGFPTFKLGGFRGMHRLPKGVNKLRLGYGAACYMAPEQQFSPHSVCMDSDAWAFGTMLIAVLTEPLGTSTSTTPAASVANSQPGSGCSTPNHATAHSRSCALTDSQSDTSSSSQGDGSAVSTTFWGSALHSDCTAASYPDARSSRVMCQATVSSPSSDRSAGGRTHSAPAGSHSSGFNSGLPAVSLGSSLGAAWAHDALSGAETPPRAHKHGGSTGQMGSTSYGDDVDSCSGTDECSRYSTEGDSSSSSGSSSNDDEDDRASCCSSGSEDCLADVLSPAAQACAREQARQLLQQLDSTPLGVSERTRTWLHYLAEGCLQAEPGPRLSAAMLSSWLESLVLWAADDAEKWVNTQGLSVCGATCTQRSVTDGIHTVSDWCHNLRTIVAHVRRGAAPSLPLPASAFVGWVPTIF